MVKLGEPAAQMCVGGSGRYFIFHLKNAKKLVVVDLTKAEIAASIDAPSDDVRFAAGAEKLLVVLPAQKLVHRYSLSDFKREKTATLPEDTPIQTVLLGASSQGPLALRGPQGRDYSPGKLLFWDIDKMAPANLPRDVVRGGPLRVSADGQSFVGWTSGLSGQQFELVKLTSAGVVRLECGHDLFRNQAPSADGRYVVCDNGLLITDQAKHVPADAFKDTFMLPCINPAMFLAVPNAPGGKPMDVQIVTLCDQQIIYRVKEIELLGNDRGYRSDPCFFNGEPRVHFAPALKIFATFPEGNDHVVIRNLDLPSALKQEGGDYLFVVSQPPSSVQVGETFSYKPFVLTSGKGTKFKLESGPEGLTVADSGQITWKVKQPPPGGAVRVVASASNDSGKEIFHSFELTLGRTAGEPVASAKPQAEPNKSAPPAKPEATSTPPAFPKPATPVFPGAGNTQGAPAELAARGKFRLEGGKCDLNISRAAKGQGLLVLQQDQLSLLAADGITIRKQIKLPKKYTHLAERETYYVALAAAPRAIDLLDKETLKVTKTFKVPDREATDLALHPTKPICYAAYKTGIDVPRYHFLVYNEETGDGREAESNIGKWLQVSPDGDFLYAGYSDIYNRGGRLLINPDNIFVVPEYGSIDWIIRYELESPEKPRPVETKLKAGGNGRGLRLSADGRRLTYLSYVGYPMHSGNLAGWDPLDLEKSPVAYATKDRATTQELDFHPQLPLAISYGKSGAVVFDREQGDELPDRAQFADDANLAGNIRRIYFTPDGRHVLAEAVVNDIHYLVQGQLKLSPDELKQIGAPAAPKARSKGDKQT